MIYNFPKPYPDELLYSILGRYQLLVGNTSPKQTTDELFGKRSVRSVIELPCNLSLLAERISNPCINADYIIDHHTMFPFYGAFLLREQYEDVREIMKSQHGGSVYTTAGIVASNIVPKKNLMHCEKCSEEDHQTYGETYWHRLHQLPGVFVCNKHKMVLHETSVAIKAKNQHEYIIATQENTRKQNNVSIDDKSFEHLLSFATLASELLTNHYRQIHSNQLYRYYKRKLTENNLVTQGGNVKRSKLYASFRGFFSETLPTNLQSSIKYTESDWLTTIFQHHRNSFHPIRHLLVMMYLGGSLSSYFEEFSPFQPFGEGPWLCLNPACHDFQKAVVTELKVTRCYETKRSVGAFLCHCGFIYSRKGPDLCKEDQFKIGCIRDFGHVWQNKLKELISEGGTLTGIANTLQCDPQTVKRQAVFLKLPFSWKGESLESASKKARFQKGDLIKQGYMEISHKKDEWLSLQELNPDLSKTELRRSRPELYAFLYRNDKDWLNKFSPRGRKHVYVNNRVKWDERDSEILEAVKKCVEEWDKYTDKPTRISLGAIGYKIKSRSLLEKKADKLPKTMNYINSVAEDIEEFQLRRVKRIVEKMKEEGEELLEWRIYQKAGLRSDVSNKVKRLITMLSSDYDY